MSAPVLPYTIKQLAPGSYDIFHDGAPIASLVRNLHRDGATEAWAVELLDDIPEFGRPAPFTAHRHFFRSRSEALRWLGASPRRVSGSKPAHQAIRRSTIRRGSLTMRDRYQLRLLALHARFYGPNTSLQTLEEREFIARTGRTDGGVRVEWAITNAGRMALAEVE